MEFRGKYWFLCNYYGSGFTDPATGVSYKTVEHYYQSKKTTVHHQNDAIRTAITPGESKRLGRKCTMRKDWDEIKIDVMRNALVLKFSQNLDLYNRLIATGDTELVEGNTWGDTFWGVCNGVGENRLGKMLMQVRLGLTEFARRI